MLRRCCGSVTHRGGKEPDETNFRECIYMLANIFRNWKMVWISALIGVTIYILDTVVDAEGFNEGTIIQQLFHPEGMEIWTRSLIFLLSLLFGLVAQNMMNQHIRTNQRLPQSTHNPKYIFEHQPTLGSEVDDSSRQAAVHRLTWAATFTVIILCIVAAGSAFYRVEAQRIRLDKYHELAAISELKASQIEQWRHERLVDVTRDVSSVYFRRATDAWLKQPNDLALRDEYRERLNVSRKTDAYSDVLLLDPNGRILLSAIDNPSPVDTATTKAIARALQVKHAALSDLFRSPDGDVFLDAVAPVLNASDEVIAFMVLRSNASDFLYPLIQSWPVPSRSAETVLAQKEGDDVLFLNELRHQAGTALSLRIPLTRSDIPAVQAALGKQAMMEGKDYRGIEVLSDLRPIPGSAWFIVAKVDAAEILAVSHSYAVFITVFVVLFILLAAAVVAFTYRHRQASLYRILYGSEREKRQVQEALRQSEEQHRIILQTAMDGFWLVDMQGRLLEVNKAYCQMSGYSARELLAMHVSELEAAETSDDIAVHIEKTMSQG
jgi:PAS domain-containing protein